MGKIKEYFWPVKIVHVGQRGAEEWKHCSFFPSTPSLWSLGKYYFPYGGLSYS
jgi:hypothetical protein